MSHRARPAMHVGRIAGLAALGLVLAAGAWAVVVWPVLVGEPGVDSAFALVLFPGLGWYWALGAVIVLRADGHLVGWLFAISAAMVATVFACWVAGPILSAADPATMHPWFVLAGALLFPTALLLALPAVMLTFPTGHLPGARWRWPVVGLAALTALGAVATLLRPGSLDGYTSNPLTPLTSGLPPSVAE